MQLSAKGETLNVSEQERFFDDALSWALDEKRAYRRSPNRLEGGVKLDTPSGFILRLFSACVRDGLFRDSAEPRTEDTLPARCVT